MLRELSRFPIANSPSAPYEVLVKFEILTFSDELEPQVRTLWELVFTSDPGRNEPSQMIARKRSVQPELFLVGTVDGTVVASVMGGYDGVRGWMYHLATHPEHRLKNYATLLVAELERRLRALGCIKLNLQVRAGNDSVTRFYEKLGYQIEPRTSLGKVL